jgi:hypothetical protein
MYSSQPPPQEPQTSDTQVRNIIMDHLQRGSFYQTFRLFPCILLLKIWITCIIIQFDLWSPVKMY